jgi:hypothetical protein
MIRIALLTFGGGKKESYSDLALFTCQRKICTYIRSIDGTTKIALLTTLLPIAVAAARSKARNV